MCTHGSYTSSAPAAPVVETPAPVARPVQVTKLKTLTPKTFDTLRAMAAMFGGIGAGQFHSLDGSARVPMCVIGYARTARELKAVLCPVPGSTSADEYALENELDLNDIGPKMNDYAVRSFNARNLGVPVPEFGAPWGTVDTALDVRINFDAWITELNIVRGE